MNPLLKIIQKPSIVGIFILLVFLATTGYKLGWDDQHLEIPTLKSLIDPQLYPNDYYVQSLKKNFTSFLYPILAKTITIEQIPTTYFLLYLLSRYFLFYWIYRLWLLIAKDRYKALMATLAFILLMRVDELMYRTFSHQEFALGIIFGGIYFFFKERFLLASIFLGIATNFHALYSLFPMSYLSIYLLFSIKKRGWGTFLKSNITYLLFSLPFLIWTYKTRLTHHTDPSHLLDWVSLYVTTCPQNFFFNEFPLVPLDALLKDWNFFYYAAQYYVLLLSLFFYNLFFNPLFRRNGMAMAYSLTAIFFIGLCWNYTYLHPNKFILDINLIRNTQFLQFLMLGFTTIHILNKIEKGGAAVGFTFALLLASIKYGEMIGIAAIGIMAGIEILQMARTLPNRWARWGVSLIGIAAIGRGSLVIHHILSLMKFKYIIWLFFLCIIFGLFFVFIIFIIIKNETIRLRLKKIFLIVPFTVFFLQYGTYHLNHIKMERYGTTFFWQLQKSWEDMQHFVQANTPKDAVILAPYDMEMGGFRIFSERSVIVCYRDCGIVGFDYEAAQEWMRRIRDIEAFKVVTNSPPIEIYKIAIMKYHASYIVFPRIYAPKETSLLEKLYANHDFMLYKVNLFD